MSDRDLKLCINCKYYNKGNTGWYNTSDPSCDHPINLTVATNLITGKTTKKYVKLNIYYMRYGLGPECGAEGKLFEAKV